MKRWIGISHVDLLLICVALDATITMVGTFEKSHCVLCHTRLVFLFTSRIFPKNGVVPASLGAQY